MTTVAKSYVAQCFTMLQSKLAASVMDFEDNPFSGEFKMDDMEVSNPVIKDTSAGYQSVTSHHYSLARHAKLAAEDIRSIESTSTDVSSIINRRWMDLDTMSAYVCTKYPKLVQEVRKLVTPAGHFNDRKVKALEELGVICSHVPEGVLVYTLGKRFIIPRR